MTAIVTLEEFENQADKDLVQFTGYFLQKTYPGYLWMCRLLAKGMVGFTMAEIMQYGDAHVMVVHPRDCPTQDHFEKLVKKLGGELLERSRLNRGESKNVAVTKRPDGFNAKFDQTEKTTKIILKDQ